jgi:hypothetical protein
VLQAASRSLAAAGTLITVDVVAPITLTRKKSADEAFKPWAKPGSTDRGGWAV